MSCRCCRGCDLAQRHEELCVPDGQQASGMGCQCLVAKALLKRSVLCYTFLRSTHPFSLPCFLFAVQCPREALLVLGSWGSPPSAVDHFHVCLIATRRVPLVLKSCKQVSLAKDNLLLKRFLSHIPLCTCPILVL